MPLTLFCRCQEETHLSCQKGTLQQVHVYSEPARDKRRHTASVVFTCRVEGAGVADDDASALTIVPAAELRQTAFAFDHQRILLDFWKWHGAALERQQQQLQLPQAGPTQPKLQPQPAPLQ